RPQDRVGDGMIAADGERDHAGVADPPEESFDVGMTLLEAEAALHRDIADVRRLHMQQRRDAERVLVGPDPLHGADRARTQPRPGPVGDAQVHRHADQRRIDAAEVRRRGGIRTVGETQKSRGARERPFALVAPAEHLGRDLGEARLEDVAAFRAAVLPPESVELAGVHLGPPIFTSMPRLRSTLWRPDRAQRPPTVSNASAARSAPPSGMRRLTAARMRTLACAQASGPSFSLSTTIGPPARSRTRR